MILRIGYTWLKNIDDAEDICQIVLLKLLQDGRSFADIKQERAWIIRVSINACKNWKASAWFRHCQRLDSSLSLHIEPIENAEMPETTGEDLLQMVNRLPLKYRRVIYLRYYEGYAVNEIADLLKISPALVSTHLARAKAKLKKQLGDDDLA